MKGNNIVVINGRHYDAITGVAISDTALAATVTATPLVRTKAFHDVGPRPSAALNSQPHASARPRDHSQAAPSIHIKPQKSSTLHRGAIKKPGAYAAQSAPTALTRSTLITKFGHNNSHIKPAPLTNNVAEAHIAHTVHKPVHTPAVYVKPATATSALTPAQHSKQLKEQLIKDSLSKTHNNSNSRSTSNPLRRLAAKRPKAAAIVTMSLTTILLGGYLTYVNMPNLSVRVASARAGVNAQFPEYRPDGYSFAGPVAYAPGEVTISFKANGDAKGYEIKQRASNWDSQAVLDNYVTRESTSYLTYSEQGLTIYTYANKAAWVSGGILYTINGDAPLSSEQVLRIAGSM